MVPLVVVLAACDSQTKTQLRTLAKADSLRTDSLVSIKNELLNEVMASTQFVRSQYGQRGARERHREDPRDRRPPRL